MKKLVTKILFCGILAAGTCGTSFAAFPVVTPAAHQSAPSNPTTSSFEVSVAPEASSATATKVAAPRAAKGSGGKSQIVAILLALLVGGLGIHRFYLGYTWQGVVQLLTGGGFGIWALIDLIRIIIGTLEPKNGPYDKTI